MSSSSATKVVLGSFGRLWGRGHERLEQRKIWRIQGPGATTYLQNLVTSNLLASSMLLPRAEPFDAVVPSVPKRLQPPTSEQQPPRAVEFNTQLQATCFLDPKGRVITDALLWKQPEKNNHSNNQQECHYYYYLDVPGDSADVLWQHLHQYKLRRSNVTVTDCSDTVHSYVVYGTLESSGTPPGYWAGLDPRHPSLGLRILQPLEETKTNNNDSVFADLMTEQFPAMPGNYELVRRLVGVAEGREIAGRVALETNQELLNAISFDKGCYLGQELTARVFHTGFVRKRIMPVLLQNVHTQIPQPWTMASSLQEGRRNRRFTAKELKHVLPSRLPRLSVLAAGNMVAIMTGSIQPNGPAVDEAAEAEWAAAQVQTRDWMEGDLTSLTVTAAAAKMVDVATGSTVGQIVAPPLPGTNVALALMRLETVGLLRGGVWSATNSKVRIHDKEFRYLPYLPLWWPELNLDTGKARTDRDDDDDNVDARDDTITNGDKAARPPPGMTRVEIEEIPINESSSSK